MGNYAAIKLDAKYIRQRKWQEIEYKTIYRH